MPCDPRRKNLLRAAARGSEPQASVVGLCLEEVIGFSIKKISSIRKGKCANLLPPQGGLHAVLTLLQKHQSTTWSPLSPAETRASGRAAARRGDGTQSAAPLATGDSSASFLLSAHHPVPHQTAGNLSSEPLNSSHRGVN